MPVVSSGCLHWFRFSGGIYIVCPQMVAGCWLLVGRSGAVVPLLTGAAPTPWRPSPTGASSHHIEFFSRQ